MQQHLSAQAAADCPTLTALSQISVSQDVITNTGPTSSDHLLNLSLDMDFTRFHLTVPVDDEADDEPLVSSQHCCALSARNSAHSHSL